MPFTESERPRLERGEILTDATDGPGGRRDARARALLAAPVERVWDAVTDYDHYRDFMPFTTVSQVRRREGNTVWFYTELDLTVRTIKYEIKLVLDKPRWTVDWTLVEGNLKSNEGSWRLEAAGEGETFATYTAFIGISLWLPAAVVNKFTQGSLPQLLNAVRKRIGDAKYLR
jgi:ribosome-associated toxin RatA of RatAB toxin-antitoxin module